jgi:hypothetical protein
MAGNVAEWTRLGDSYAAYGGSFRAQLAGELKTWSSRLNIEPNDATGVRCAFDVK